MSRFAQTTKVNVVIAGLGLIGALECLWLTRVGVTFDRPTVAFLPVVVVLAILAEVKYAKIYHGDQAHAVMWAEIPATIAILFMNPVVGILAQVIAAFVGYVWRTRAFKAPLSSKSAFETCNTFARLGMIMWTVCLISGPPTISSRTLIGLVVGVLASELLTHSALLLIFRSLGQRPSIKEWMRSEWFALWMAETLVVSTFGFMALVSISWLFFVCGLMVPVAVIFGGPYLSRLVQSRNDWSRHGHFLGTLDESESSIEDILRLMRSQIGAERIDMVARYGKARKQYRYQLDSNKYEAKELPSSATPDPLFHTTSDRVVQEVSFFNSGDMPRFLQPHQSAMVVSIGTDDNRTVWAVSGYEGQDGTAFPDSSAELFAAMCWAIHNKLDARRRMAEAQRRSTHDPITDLWNREGFRAHLNAAVKRSHTNEGLPCTIAFLDLDGFKTFNESWGHDVGDRLLIHVADQLRKSVPANTALARLSGDEFAIIMELATDEELTQTLIKVNEAIAEPFEPSEGAIYRGTVSIGFATYPSLGIPQIMANELPDEFASQLLRHADSAMSYAKASKAIEPLPYDPSRDSVNEASAGLAAEISEALNSDALTIHLQPIYDARSFDAGGKRLILGWEALARIERAVGNIMPADFITVAEKTKQIHAVTERVIDLACRQLAAWVDYDVTIAVNLSVANLADASIVSKIEGCLRQHKVEPSRLVAEVTESVMMLDAIKATEVLAMIQALGVRISMDDFGTGHSSLARLGELPLNEVKIDRKFVTESIRAVHPDDKDGHIQVFTARTILTHMVSLARDLGVPCTVEGIETTDGLALVQSLGVNKIQGYIGSRPIPAPQASILLAQSARKRDRTTQVFQSQVRVGTHGSEANDHRLGHNSHLAVVASGGRTAI